MRQYLHYLNTDDALPQLQIAEEPDNQKSEASRLFFYVRMSDHSNDLRQEFLFLNLPLSFFYYL